jgi:hypothetical protein
MPKIIINHITIKTVIDIIDKWEGKLTWELLCYEVSKALGLKTTITRNALQSHGQIKLAFQTKKGLIYGNYLERRKHDGESLERAIRYAKSLEKKIIRLEAENRALVEQFIIWQHHLASMGADMSSLIKPLPKNKRA